MQCVPLRRRDSGLHAKHIVMTNGQRILTVPRHDPINAFTMGGLVRDAGLSVEQFRKLL